MNNPMVYVILGVQINTNTWYLEKKENIRSDDFGLRSAPFKKNTHTQSESATTIIIARVLTFLGPQSRFGG